MSLIRRAEAAGYKAIVLSIDQPVVGKRSDVIRNNFKLPGHLQLANFVGTEKDFKRENDNDSCDDFVHGLFNDALTWKDVQWLIGFTKLPVIVKGILTAEDAVIAADIGCIGIIVSNHGARQLDSVLATVSIQFVMELLIYFV